MKKFFKSSLLLLTALLPFSDMSAQMPGQVPVAPVDSAIRTGVLPNGLTYYIRHNETPKGQADFYIAQKVGSILEEDNQRGLAHFLEHMCFNGTENFPGKRVIEWLETVGVRFGYNLNAYTGVDETVYNISSVPVARKSVQDSCLLILHDWANALTLDPKEIDAERGVIHEEWRRRMVGTMRIIEQQLPTIYPGSKYAYRLPIGTMEVVDNFKPEVLVDYYRTWYRPDQQGVIVVGDIDPDYIEAKIKELFTPIKMPENAKEREYYTVSDTPGTIYALGKDKEMQMGMMMMMFKTDPMLPREMRNTQAYYPVMLMTRLVTDMLNARLSEVAKKPDAKFAQASVEFGDMFIAATKEALTVQIITKGDNVAEALESAYREILRATRGGFTSGEYERAKAQILSEYEKAYNERNSTPNEKFSQKIVDGFIENEPLADAEFEYNTVKQMLQMLPVQAINQLLPELVKNDNRVVFGMFPDSETYAVPTQEQLAATIAAVDAEDIEPYRDEMKAEPLIPQLPTPGSIVATKDLPEWGATEWTLSNGVKVVVKNTAFKENDIQFSAVSRKGYAGADNSIASTLKFLPYAIYSHGLGDYTASDMEKYLQGNQAKLNISIDAFSSNLDGSTTVKDLTTLMEMIYMTFKDVSITADEFSAMQNMIKGVLANQESTPEYIFQKHVQETLYAAPARHILTTADIDAASREATLDIVHSMFDNAADFTFVFVGSIDEATFKPLVEQYIATLPADAAKAQTKLASNLAYEPAGGTTINNFNTKMETPQTWAFVGISGLMPYTASNSYAAKAYSHILGDRLLTKVREDMGATYAIGAYGSLSRIGESSNILVQIPFPMKPELKTDVLNAVNDIIVSMASTITPDEITKTKEYLTKTAAEELEKNENWARSISSVSLNGVQTFTNAIETIDALTIDDVQKFAAELFNQDNIRMIILNPAE